ncbi:Ribosomal-protein-S18p-alanine acetyltransferase [Candidatus Phaeomarinobacter ectocarpi]|uniref:Ribosomal-protein-S18p-alanine acetyltransferase n=1 Tax=Candidatus Phaeomarinibacter ectocarpi TaxID=1458461 RepID=X5MLV9_9HYPH|nr:ribosomal protein S18-alanine N-acetyltransferase [Candidatus Phaeomarinobacter ectocarpi]CDO59840.1 Ribosomal-protein-S18p-alanine acetyltransferase [Candidatus Phaeomarinobacter ectocarpi]
MPDGANWSPQVRPGDAQDVAAMAHIHASAFDEKSAWSAPSLLHLVETPNVFALMVERDGTPAGFVLMRVAASEAEVLTIAVDPAFHRQGMARALVMAGLTAALAVECDTVFLEVATDNEPAKALYQSMGFDIAGERKAYYARPAGPAVDALVLRWTAQESNPAAKG